MMDQNVNTVIASKSFRLGALSEMQQEPWGAVILMPPSYTVQN